MSKKGTVQNVRRHYRQQVLSGYEHIIQPQDESGDNSQNEQGGEVKLPPKFWKSKAYQVTVKLIVEKARSSGDKYKFRIRINDDADLLVATYATQSKRVSKETVTIPGKGSRPTVSIPMVYGIHQEGISALSPTDGHTLPEAIAQFYSFLLVNLDRTIERIILEQKDAPGNDDTGKRVQGNGPSKKLGTDKAKRRRGKVLPKVRDEAIPEVSPQMVETYGEILGERLSDIQNRLGPMGNDTHIGEEPERLSVDF